jgi:hypothetical protein
MKIDPNFAVQLERESVLCTGSTVVLWDGQVVPDSELATDGGPFASFCKSLDPNRCFIDACVPEDEDRVVFFLARDVAKRFNLHMQASVDTPERHHLHWRVYCENKRQKAQSRKERAAGSVAPPSKK